MNKDYKINLDSKIKSFSEFGLDTAALEEYIFTQKRWININLKKKRNRKKYLNSRRDFKYKYISKKVRKRLLGFFLSHPIRRRIDYQGIASQIVTVEPLN